MFPVSYDKEHAEWSGSVYFVPGCNLIVFGSVMGDGHKVAFWAAPTPNNPCFGGGARWIEEEVPRGDMTYDEYKAFLVVYYNSGFVGG